MNNFDWTQFTNRVYINTRLKKVYDAWTVPNEIEKWFLSDCNFVSKEGNALEKSKNVTSESKYSWRWFAQNHSEEGFINQTNGVDYVEFTFAGECIVQVKLSEKDNMTLVELTQSNIPLDNNSKEGIRLGCAFGWTFYLTNLKSILEGGIDLRNKDITLKGVVNN